MVARVLSATPWGVDARSVRIAVDLHHGLPRLDIEGLPSDAAARESRQRVRSAIRQSGVEWPLRQISVRLDPVDRPKDASALDLAIAAAILVALGELPQVALDDHLICGDLDLDGRVRSVRGGISIAETAAREGIRAVVLPARNAPEAAALDSVSVLPVRSLAQLVEHFRGLCQIPPLRASTPTADAFSSVPDFCEIRGNEAAKRALEVAAAGGHHLLMVGPAGAGKTMLARRLPGILPPLDRQQSIELTKILSVVSEEPPENLLQNRPFRSPHPGVSTAGMTGGGRLPRPGEVTLAHGGVLFLDELPEFRREALDALRQPLDEGTITIIRSRYRLEMPARFTLLVAMTACPCSGMGHPERSCRCSSRVVERYRSRIPAFLRERIDIHTELVVPSKRELSVRPGEKSVEVAARVLAAREIQTRRFAGRPSPPTNVAITPEDLARYCPLDQPARALLDLAIARLHLDPRAQCRILRVARTIADLDRCDRIGPAHVGEAIQYRLPEFPEADR